VIHVEAGPRTGGHNFSPFPEEFNRQLITRIASFHLAPTAKNQETWCARPYLRTRSS
jgi:UDP-N-acetylglucosamine 2-epimerase (non-hydrolysing)